MTGRMLIAVVIVAGCSSPVSVEPDENGRVIGTIDHYGDGVRMELPTSVGAGDEILVRVLTYGGGCTAKGDTDVVQRSLSVTITPYDHEPAGSVVCSALLRVHWHEAVIAFENRGVANVTIIGKRRPGDELVTVSRSILIE